MFMWDINPPEVNDSANMICCIVTKTPSSRILFQILLFIRIKGIKMDY
eukprot:UN11907